MDRDRSVATALLAAPLVLFLVCLLGYPVIAAVRLALTDPVSGVAPTAGSFRVLWNDRLFWRAAAGNLVIPVGSVAVELVAGVGLALLLAARMPARRLVRAMVVVPFALPEIVFLAITRGILTPHGYMNAALASVGVGPVGFLVPGRATTYVTVVLVDAWHTTPVVFLIVLGGLAAIPRQIHEAAALDGARGWRHLVFVTLPLLRPTIVAAVLVRGLDALRIFAAPLVLAGVEGAPVLSTYAYHQWSDYGDDGAAAAAALVLALLCVVASVPLLARRAARAELG